jgi:ABC-type bacteriocin/lantibiotic exporter with double-glycine peptidase domain
VAPVRPLAIALLGGLLFCEAISAEAPPGVWLDVPYIQQSKDACGAASIAMVIEYWQIQQKQTPAADALQIQHALYSSRAHGIYASNLQEYLEEQGYRAFSFRGDWNLLKENLTKGRPLIVALKVGHNDRHYVVVVGMDWQRSIILENDPAQRKLLKQDQSHFVKEWDAAGAWTLLAVPQDAAQSGDKSSSR